MIGCKKPCTEYSGAADEDGAVTEHCGPTPLPGGGSMDDYNGCVGRTRAQYQQLGPHCEVVRSVESGIQTNLMLVGVYTAAAGVCAAACAASAAKIVMELAGIATFGAGSLAAQALEAVETACKFGTYGAAAADAAGTLKLMIEGKPWEQWWMIPVYGPGAAGSMAMAGIAVGAQTVGREAGNRLAKEGAQTIAEKATDQTREQALKTGEEAADKGFGELAASCISAASLGLAAVAKAATLGVAAGVGAASCMEIANLQGWGSVKPQGQSSSARSGAFTDLGGQQQTGSTVDGGDAPHAYSANVPESTDLDGPQFSGALGDASGRIFKSLPNRNRIGSAAKLAFNVTPRSIARRVASGETPGNILAGLNGMNSGLGSAFKRLDQLAAEGRISGKGFGADAGLYRGGGGGGGESGGDDFNPMSMIQGIMDQINQQGKGSTPTDIKGVRVVGMAYEGGRTAEQIAENRNLSIFDRVSYRYLKVGGRMLP